MPLPGSADPTAGDRGTVPRLVARARLAPAPGAGPAAGPPRGRASPGPRHPPAIVPPRRGPDAALGTGMRTTDEAPAGDGPPRGGTRDEAAPARGGDAAFLGVIGSVAAAELALLLAWLLGGLPGGG